MATKTFYAVKEAIVANGQTVVSEAVNKGAGRDYHLPAGNIVIGGTATNNDVRSLIQFTYDFSDVASITSATLYLKTARATDGVIAGYTRAAHGTFGSGTTLVSRVTSEWSAGVRGNDELWYTDNAVTWANKPSTTTSSRGTVSNTATRPADPTLVSVSITAMMQEFLAGQTNYGIELRSSSEGGTGFQEYYSSHAESDGLIAGATGPYIVLDYTEVTASKGVKAIISTPPNLGIAEIANLDDESEWSSTSYSAAPYFAFNLIKGTSGSAINTWRLAIFEGTSVAGTQVFSSGEITQEPALSYRSISFSSTKPSWMPGSGWLDPNKTGLANGSAYTYQLIATDTKGSASTAVATAKVRWAQAIYEFDAGASWLQTSLWNVYPNAPEKNTAFGVVYRALTATNGNNASAVLGYAKGNASSMTYYAQSKIAYVTGVNSADGTLVTYAGTNTFSAGDYINITGISTSTQYNLSNVTVTSASGTTFTVASTSTGAFSHTGNNRPYAVSAHPFAAGQKITTTGITVSAGTNTYNVTGLPIGAVSSNTSGTITNVTLPSAGTVRYSATNNYSVGDVVTVYGVNPVAYNTANATVSAATTAYFDIASAATGTYVSSAGRAQAITLSVNEPGSATYSSGGTATVAWTNDISSITPVARYLQTTVRLTSNDGANQPILSSLEFEYADSALAADYWFSIGGNSVLDAATRRFGTKSLRFTANSTALITESYNISNASGDGTVVTYTSAHNFAAGNVVTITGISPSSYNIAGGTISAITSTSFSVAGTASAAYVSGGNASRSQFDSYIAVGDAYSSTPDVSVVPNTNYSYSVYVKPNVIYAGNEIRARIYEGGTALGAVIADSGPHTAYEPDNEGWYRLTTTFNSGPGRNSVRPTIYLANNSNINGNSFFSDGAQLEEGDVVRSWTPGFVTSGITMEGGGLKVDGLGGGSFRLRGSGLGIRNVVELGSSGLLFGGDVNPVEVYSANSSDLTVTGSLSATALTTAGTVTIGGDTELYRQSANKLATPDTFVTLGGTVEFGSSNDTNLYRSAANYLKTDDVFYPANIAAGVYTGTWGVTDVWSVTGLNVLSSAGTAGGTANFAIMVTPWRTGTAHNAADTWTYAIRSTATTFTSGRLTGFTLMSAENAAYEPNGFYWMVIGL